MADLSNGNDSYVKYTTKELLQQIAEQLDRLEVKLDDEVRKLREDLKTEVQDRETRLVVRIEDHEGRLRALESEGNKVSGIRSYKQWVIPVLVLIIVNVISWYIWSPHSTHIPSNGTSIVQIL